VSVTRNTDVPPTSRTHAGNSFRVPGPKTIFGDGLEAKGAIIEKNSLATEGTALGHGKH
jgi:hypothetical protein